VGKEGYDPYGDLLTQVIDGVDSWTAPPTLEELVVVAPAYRLTQTEKGGWALSVLHSFSGLDGDGPGAGLIVDSAGNLLRHDYVWEAQIPAYAAPFSS